MSGVRFFSILALQGSATNSAEFKGIDGSLPLDVERID